MDREPHSRPHSAAAARTLPDRGPEMDKWRRRSHAVRFWRRALPVTIAVIGAVLVAWIAGRSLFIKATAPKPPQATGLRMLNPRFYGRDSSNHAFVLGAAEAARDSSTGKSVSLAAPDLTMDAGGAQPTTVRAAHGVYREDQRQLSLTGQVELKAGGYVFTTPDATVDTSKGAVYG